MVAKCAYSRQRSSVELPPNQSFASVYVLHVKLYIVEPLKPLTQEELMKIPSDQDASRWLKSLSLDDDLPYSWWEAWRFGERDALIQGLGGELGQEVAAREVDALEHVRAWDTPLRPLLVWTGFEPFDVHATNPSGAVAEIACERSRSSRWDCSALTLPVTYDQAQRFALEHDKEPERPLFLIHLGLAAARAEVCFEVFAHNITGAKPDNDGQCGPASRILDPRGPLARRTSLPVVRMCELWAHCTYSAPPLAARESHDAGDYICNAILYHSLSQLERRPGPGAAIFIHLPALKPSMYEPVANTLAELITGLVLGVSA